MKKIFAVLLAVCLLAGAMPFTAGAARTDVSTIEGFMSKLLLGGYFYDYDCDTINETKTTSSFSYEEAIMKVFAFPSCIDADYDMSKNVYNLKFGVEKSYHTLPLTDAKWLYTTIFNWSESTWTNMLSYANSRGGYIDKSRKYVYIRNNKLYCIGADRGDWPNRLKTVSRQQDGNRVELVLDWYTADDYYGEANKLARKIYALVEQKTVSGKKYWTIHRTKTLGNKENPLAVAGFDDVTGADFFADSVKWAVENKITSGTGDTTFSPNQNCDRGQIMTFLWKAAGQPEPKTSVNPFSDVKASDYFYKPVLWAVENKITSGTSDTTFSPKADCTRGQAMTFLWKSAGSPSPAAGTSFNDVVSGSFYEQAVNWAVGNKVTSGTSATTFSPENKCTRGQIMTFLYKAKDL